MGLYTELPADIKEVDVIIAGGGTTGCVIAGRLAEADPDLSILVIEGGTNNDLPSISIPLLFRTHVMPTSKTNVFHMANKSKDVGNRALSVASGRILGGGSSMNFLMYSRAQRSDWDSWKTPGWSADEVLPYIKKLENYQGPGAKDVHGYDGPVQVSPGTFSSKRFQDDFIAAAGKVGFPEVDDLQSLDANNAVARPMRYISADAKRQDAASAYVHPKLRDGEHPKLHVLVTSRIVRVLFDNKRAVGVEYKPNPDLQPDADAHKPPRIVKARRMVVVSCGALGTPPVLERSGIGGAEVLERAGVPLVAEVPGIGRNYQDHHLQLYSYQSNLGPEETLDAFIRGKLNLEEMVKNNDKRLGWNGQDVACRIRPNEADVAALGPEFQLTWDQHFKGFPDRPLALMSAISCFPGDPTDLPDGQYMSVSAFTCYPLSRGHIHITGPGLSDPLDFETGFLADGDGVDIKKHVWIYKKQREIVRRMQAYRGEVPVNHPPFPPESKAACKTLDSPLTDVRDIEYSAEDDAILETWLREHVGATWHPLGTCKMGPREEMGVVDPSLSVYGVEGLKVADLSIAPCNVAANTNNTALAVGEKAAAIFIEELGLEKK